MTRTKMIAALAVSAAAGFATTAKADLIAYWNFTDFSANTFNSGQLGVLNSIAPAQGGGTLSIGGTPTMAFNTTTVATANGTVGAFAGTTVNGVVGEVNGGALTVVGNTGGVGTVSTNGGWVQFEVDMTNFEDLVVSFATRGTGTGFNSGQLSWSTDGALFTDFGATWAGNVSSFFAVSRDLSSITDIDNVSTVFVRLTLGGATGASGNNRIDNVQFNATQIPAPGALALLGLSGLVAARRRRA